ncbi:MAG TPA: gephyrin-like molybdotransferase Glp [Actinomycetota bacterium]|nr:gephyrin-like molybdotransferase Glp [Actinomycetota bacterium]
MALSVDEARRLILEAVPPLQPIELPLAEAYGCVLAADVVAEYDIPAFSSAEVRGVAARSADIAAATAAAPVTLRVVGTAAPGRPAEVTVGWGEAVRIAPGAAVPAGADCVVPIEEAVSQEAEVVEAVASGSGIRPAGDDVGAGSLLVPGGRRLSSAEMGLLALAGLGGALAYPKVRVAVLSIGPLVEPGRPAGMGQIRDANSYLLLGALRDAGAVPYRLGNVTRAETELREMVQSNLLRADAFVVSGAAPAEAGEAVALALAGMGDVETYDVAAHPGSSFGFGVVEGKPFFSLSRKVAAAFVTFELFGRPAVLRLMGRRDLRRPEVRAVLEDDVSSPADVERYVPSRVGRREGTWHCAPTGPSTDDRLAPIVRANGLAVIPPEGKASKGDEVAVQILRPMAR